MSEAMRADEPAVLMVDDEKKVADAYALRLKGVAEVTVAYGGQAALETLDASETPPDVVLLDRHMPGVSGDEVLREMRDRDLDSRVIMVTAIDPELEILDLPFHDYLCKPVEREDLRAAVDQQCQVLGYELLGEYFKLESKRAVIEAELPANRLDEHEEFSEMKRRSTTLRERIARLLPDARATLSTFDGIDREGY